MADVQITVIDQQNTQLALAAPEETQVNIAVPGVQGPTGEGVPVGGSANQVLFKQSGTNYDTAWGNVTSAMIGDLEIVNADVAAAAAIAGTKISPNFGSQNVITTGTSTAASFIPTSSTVPTNGVYLPSANNLAISTNGTGRLFVDASGNVGIGAAPLSSEYSLYIERSTGTSPRIALKSTVANSYPHLLLANDVKTYLLQIDGSNDGLRVYDNTLNTERLRITSDGKLGLGASSPGANIHLANALAPTIYIQSENATANTFGELRFGNGTGGTSALSSVRSYRVDAATAETALAFETTNSSGTKLEALRITSSQRVGIGTSSPNGNLHVSGSSSSLYDSTNMLSTNSFFRASNTDTTAGIATGITFEATGDGAQAAQAAIRCVHTGSGAAALALGTKRGAVQPVAEALRIDSSGRVGIGTLTPDRSLHVQSAGSSIVSEFEATALGFASIDLSNTAGYARFTSVGNSLAFAPGGTEAARIDSSGTFRVKGAGSAGTTDAVQLNGSAPANSLLLDASGRVLVGTTTSLTDHFGGNGVNLQLAGSSYQSSAIQLNAFGSNQFLAPHIVLNKGRGTVASPSNVLQGDKLGGIVFTGYSASTANQLAARIECYVDGEPGTSGDTSDLPGRLVFSTTPNGENIPTPRMTIKADGSVGIGTESPQNLLDLRQNTPAFRQAIVAESGGYSTQFGVAYSTTNTFYIDANATGQSPVRIFNWGSNGNLTHNYNSTLSSRAFIVTDGATERARIDSSGYLRLSANSPGIQFNGDTAAANALDDYEEGTFTPSVRIDSTSGTTITLNNDFRTLRYVKVGRAVFIQGRLTSNDTPASGTLISVTLPFAPIGTAGGQNYTEVLTTRTGQITDLTKGRIENHTDLRIIANPNTFTTNNYYHLNFWYYTDS